MSFSIFPQQKQQQQQQQPQYLPFGTKQSKASQQSAFSFQTSTPQTFLSSFNQSQIHQNDDNSMLLDPPGGYTVHQPITVRNFK